MKKNTLHILLICFCIVFLSLAGVSCSGDVNEDYIELKRALNPPVYSVNFEVMNWAYKMKTRSVVHGDKLGEILPHLKNEETSRFFAWYTTTESNYDEKDRWYADYPVTRDMTLYGRFFKKQTVTVMLSPTDNLDGGWVTVEENQTGDAVDPSKICHEGIFKVPIGVEFKRGNPTKDSFTILHSYVADNERSSTNYTPIASKAHDYDFEGWYLLEDGDTEDKAVRQDGNLVILTTSTLIAKFKPTEHTVDVKPSAENSGTFSFEYYSVVSSDLPVASFTNLTSGTAIIVNNDKLTCNDRTITAVPAPGYKFSWWSWNNKDNNATTSTSAEIKVPSVSVVSAVFESVKFNVNVTTSPTGTPMGIVKRTDGSSSTLITDVSVEKYPVISGDCVSTQQTSSQTIEIKANPSAGYEFSSWCIDRGFGYERLTDGDLKITKTDFAPTFTLCAEFKPISRKLAVSVVGNGGKLVGVTQFDNVGTGTNLTVVGTNGEILSGTNCNVCITASTTTDGYYFDGWRLRGSDTTATSFTVSNDDMYVEAVFKPYMYKLSVQLSKLNIKYPKLKISDKSVSFITTTDYYTGSIESIVNGSGVVIGYVLEASVENNPIVFDGTSIRFQSGKNSVVVATAKLKDDYVSGFTFDGWYNSWTTTTDKKMANKQSYTILADTTFTSNFNPKLYNVTLTASPNVGGTLSATNWSNLVEYQTKYYITSTDSDSITDSAASSCNYLAEAIPNYGYVFSGWFINGTEKTVSFIVDGTFKTVEARFVRDTYTVNVFTSNTDDELGGWLTVDSSVTTQTTSSFTDVPYFDSTNKDGKNIGITLSGNILKFNGKTIKAVANSSVYTFDGWYINGTKMKTPIQITTDTNIYACYKYTGQRHFSVAKDKIVDFSTGNLKWNGTKFVFETSQAVEYNDNNRFYWAHNATVARTAPYTSSSDDLASSVFFGNDSVQTKLDSKWNVLSNAEWLYLFNSRANAEEKFGWGNVNGISGLIILPNTFTDPKTNKGSSVFVSHSSGNKKWADNTYDGNNWVLMEKNGAVFLPITKGSDHETKMVRYWSSTKNNRTTAGCMTASSGGVSISTGTNRGTLCGVRMVRVL